MNINENLSGNNGLDNTQTQAQNEKNENNNLNGSEK
jgi:hypothetical protein